MEEILQKARIREYQPNEVIFTGGDLVTVICYGEALLNSHYKKAFPYKILGKYTEGDIIGSKYDSESSLKPENWVLTRCTTVTLCFSKEDFDHIWRAQENFEKDNTMILVKKYTFFKPLTIQTKFKILDQLESRIYKAGSLIHPCVKSSALNLDYTEFYNPYNNLIKKEALKIKLETGSSGLYDIKGIMASFSVHTTKASKAVKFVDNTQGNCSFKSYVDKISKLKTIRPEISNRVNTIEDSQSQKYYAVLRKLNVNEGDEKDDQHVVCYQECPTFDHECRGIFIVNSGICSIVSRHHPKTQKREQYLSGPIFRGDVFGYKNHLADKISLRSSYDIRQDYCYRGDIWAHTDVHILYLPEPDFLAIPKDELCMLQEVLKASDLERISNLNQ